MKKSTLMASAFVVSALVLLSFALISSADADDNDAHMDIGTEVKVCTGTGHTTHGPSQDVSKYGENTKLQSS